MDNDRPVQHDVASFIERYRRVLIAVFVCLALLVSLWSGSSAIGNQQIDSAFQRALASFALARALNGVISVAQGTEIAIQPAGIGVGFAPGEILDPINDMVERFSWIMLLASASLGAQKVLLSMSAWDGLLIALGLVGLVWLFFVWRSRNPQLGRVFARVFHLLLVLRLMMPAIALANHWVYEQFLAEEYQRASESLNEATEVIGQINDEVIVVDRDSPESGESDTGIVQRARELYRQTVAGIDFDAQLERYKQAASGVSENAIQLIVVFVIQTIVFPLLFLYLVIALSKRLARLF